MEQRGNTRERLLSGAMELIWNQTYGSVGVEAICRRAEVKKGSFYHFFDSKEDLAVQALEGHWEKFRPIMKSYFTSSENPLEGLFAYLDSIYRYYHREKAASRTVRGCPYLQVGAEIAQENTRLVSAARQILEDYFSFFHEAVAHAAERGDLPGESDPKALAHHLFAFTEGTLTIGRIYNDPEYLAQLVPGARRILGLPQTHENAWENDKKEQ